MGLAVAESCSWLVFSCQLCALLPLFLRDRAAGSRLLLLLLLPLSLLLLLSPTSFVILIPC